MALSPSRVYDPEIGTFLQRDPLPYISKIARDAGADALGLYAGTVFEMEVRSNIKNGMFGKNLFSVLSANATNRIDATGFGDSIAEMMLGMLSMMVDVEKWTRRFKQAKKNKELAQRGNEVRKSGTGAYKASKDCMNNLTPASVNKFLDAVSQLQKDVDELLPGGKNYNPKLPSNNRVPVPYAPPTPQVPSGNDSSATYKSLGQWAGDSVNSASDALQGAGGIGRSVDKFLYPHFWDFFNAFDQHWLSEIPVSGSAEWGVGKDGYGFSAQSKFDALSLSAYGSVKVECPCGSITAESTVGTDGTDNKLKVELGGTFPAGNGNWKVGVGADAGWHDDFGKMNPNPFGGANDNGGLSYDNNGVQLGAGVTIDSNGNVNVGASGTIRF